MGCREPVSRWNLAGGILAFIAIPACWIIAGIDYADADPMWGWFFVLVLPAFLFLAALVCAHEAAQRQKRG